MVPGGAPQTGSGPIMVTPVRPPPRGVGTGSRTQRQETCAMASDATDGTTASPLAAVVNTDFGEFVVCHKKMYQIARKAQGQLVDLEQSTVVSPLSRTLSGSGWPEEASSMTFCTENAAGCVRRQAVSRQRGDSWSCAR
ncbi:uncharacterized protein LOC123430055 [Hordeum vulgare subsp. vulgare]|uniref:uncharacterized protein LOC123430055 n=1 Tax=Hordeum vulgare subsp. vulgare TaxID=112509 RepID=UPI001D1A3404|nr:uncharacterized protein LOC123430055 [Hordeum vulgare subsp. vulgare]